jgi:hypothetical protein
MKIHRFRSFLESVTQDNEPVVIFDSPTIVIHTTSESAAEKIKKEGFRTGHELGVAERRKAVYFSGQDVNPGLYARNQEGETYEGETPVTVPIDINGLRLLNMNYVENQEYVHHKKYQGNVVRGELETLPYGVDGSISFLENGSIYEVALPKQIANRLLHV